MEVTIIAAVASNGVIGKDGELPWHYPEDLQHFREETMGAPVIMGYTTFQDIVEKAGGPLPGRENIVLSFEPVDLPDGVYNANSIDEAVTIAEEIGADAVYVAGGGSVYEQFLPRADRMVLTEIQEVYEGDTYFPSFDHDRWEAVSREEEGDLVFVEYVSR